MNYLNISSNKQRKQDQWQHKHDRPERDFGAITFGRNSVSSTNMQVETKNGTI